MGNSPHELQERAAAALKLRMLEREYSTFLKTEGMERGLDSAQSFYARHGAGISCNGMSEKEVIVALGIDPGPYW